MSAVTFFYDQQIRRFLLQFIRIVSNFQVEFGTIDPNTNKPSLQKVPVIYGDASRQASQILKNNSENMLSSVPAMAVYIAALQYDRIRVQNPTHVSKVHIRERKIDPNTGLPTHAQGDSYTVERLMPVPYMLTLKMDIWTSNTEQKLQIIEQIATLFNPSMEIQNTDNYLDWSSLSAVLLTDVVWDSRSVPVGTEDSISIASMTFELPIWISPPAKQKRLGVIQKIITSVWDASGDLQHLDDAIGNPDRLLTRRTINVMGYGILLLGNNLKLLRHNDLMSGDIDLDGDFDRWLPLIDLYGTIHNGTSEIRLIQSNGHEIVGTIALHPNDPTTIIYDIFDDTLPTNTLTAITAIIDPLTINVDSISSPTVGTRYLLLNDINDVNNSYFSDAWIVNGNYLVAKKNDVIEFNGTKWFVSFDSSTMIDDEYVTNLNTGIQYMWNGDSWSKSVEGVYREGEWTLIL